MKHITFEEIKELHDLDQLFETCSAMNKQQAERWNYLHRLFLAVTGPIDLRVYLKFHQARDTGNTQDLEEHLKESFRYQYMTKEAPHASPDG